MNYKTGDVLQCINEGKVSQYFSLGVNYKILEDLGSGQFRIQTNANTITIHQSNFEKLFKKL